MFLARLENQVWAKLGPEPPTRGPEPQQVPGLFLGPIPELFSARFSTHFQEIPQIMSTPLTRRNLMHFQELQQIMSTKTQTWHSWRSQECQVWVFGFPGNASNFVGSAGSTLFEEFPGNAANFVQKKVPEWGPEKSSGIGRPGWGSWAKPWPSPDFKVGPKPSFGPALIFKSGQKHQKCYEMGPESTVWTENRST